MLTAFDCETKLIGPDAIAPRVICASFHNNDESIVLGNGDPGLLSRIRLMLTSEDITGANIRYDLACVGATWPQLIPLIFKALEEKRVHDVQLREKLLDLWRHGQIGFNAAGRNISYSLSALGYRYLGVDMSADKEGDDIWRLRYAELDGMPARDYPEEAYEYARKDAEVTWGVHVAQAETKGPLKVEHLHVYASFCLYLMTAWGLEIDPEEKDRIEAKLDEELDPKNLEVLYETGILIPAQPPRPHARNKDHVVGCPKKNCSCPPKMCKAQPERLNKKHGLVPLIENICKKNGIQVKLTDKGGVSTAKDWIEELKGFHPALKTFAHRQELIKLKTSYMPALEWPFGSGQVAKRVHPNYDPLKRTGRVSSRGNTKQNAARALYPSVAIQLADPRVRSVYKPRDGFVYSVVDYTAIDLCSLAQTMWDLYGVSTHRDQFNNDIDPHAFLGAVLAFDADKDFRSECQSFKHDDMKVYEHFLSKKESNQGWYKHWRTFAKPVGLGYPGGMGAVTMVSVCASYGISIDVEHARYLKRIWLRVYPELRRYLNDWVTAQSGEYVSPMGMHRRGCQYTELANGRALQTPAAEGMKAAMCLVTRACYDPGVKSVLYGSKPVVNMHDELVLEVPESRMWKCAEEHSRLMVEGMRTVIKDVKIKAEPELVRRWTKDAVPLTR